MKNRDLPHVIIDAGRGKFLFRGFLPLEEHWAGLILMWLPFLPAQRTGPNRKLYGKG